MVRPFVRRVILGAMVTVVGAVAGISLLTQPDDAGAAQQSATTEAFQRAADASASPTAANERGAIPAALPAVIAVARAAAGTPQIRQAVTREASTVLRQAGGILGGASARFSGGSDVLLDGPAN
jgi:hypothetical protein